MGYGDNMDDFDDYGSDPNIAASDPTKPVKRTPSFANRYSDNLRRGGGLLGSAANAGLSYLNNPGQGSGQSSSGSDDSGGGMGSTIGDVAKVYLGLKNGGMVDGPVPSLIGEAGPEEVVHSDGPPELVTQPKVEMLGANGPDMVRPLTKGPHKISGAGHRFIKSRGIKTGSPGSFKGGKTIPRFGEGGMVDDFDPYDPNAPLPPLTQQEAEAALPPEPPAPPEPQFQSPPQAPAPPPPPAMEAPPPMQGGAAGPQLPDQPPPQVGGPPPSKLDQIRAQREALKAPVPAQPSIKRQLAAAALSAVPFINRTTIPQNVAYPGYAQQVAKYNASKTDLEEQVKLEDQAFQQKLREEQLKNSQASTASMITGREATIESQKEGHYQSARARGGTEVPPGTQLTPDEAGKYTLENVAGKTFKIPTQAELARQKTEALKSTEEELPPVLTEELGLPKGMRVPDTVAEKYYALYAKRQEAKNPTLASLALKATGTGPEADQAKAALHNISATQQAAHVTVNAGNARADKSYTFNVGQLNKLEDPITQRLQRMSTLQDTINQMTPQADALIAPELLSVMAGGQGSGLRMNEAEIARIVGGRSNLESLKASLNKWQLDPTKALSITPAQRQQIRDLVGTVNGKLQQKKQVLDQANEQLLNTEDPNAHRKIVVDARNKLSAVDQGSAPPAGSAGGASGSGGSTDKVNVQIPGQPPGQIPKAALDLFLKKHPTARVL